MIDRATIERAAEMLSAAPVPEGARKLFFATREQYEAFCRSVGVEPDMTSEHVQTEPIVLDSK